MNFNKNRLFQIFILTLILFLNAAQLRAQQDNTAAYQKAIHFADSVYNMKEYESARAAYQYADRFQPGSAHVQMRIADIDVKLAELEDINRRYSIAISETRQALNASDLLRAKEQLEYALTLKPDEAWPQEKLEEINQTLKEKAELQRNFDAHIAKGSDFFSKENYNAAISEFQTALKLIPDSEEGKAKLSEVRAKVKEIDDNYKSNVARGDQLYLDNQLEGAKEAFYAALELKPDENYPKQKIEQINHIIADEAAMDVALGAIIKDADAAFDRQDYALATRKYNEALDMLSTYIYARERLQEIQRIIGENESKRLAYNEIIEKADAHFNQNRYSEAKMEYENALAVLEDENYPKRRIDEIERILSQELAEKEHIERAIAEADALFDASQWLASKNKYQEVLQLSVGNAYATQRIKTIDATLAQMEKEYGSLIVKSDNFFRANKFSEALESYMLASNIKPEETYPKQRIAEINVLLNDKEAQEQSYNMMIADADVAFNEKNWALAIEKYEAASAIKPSESYPKQQLSKANREYQSFLAMEKRYNDEITRADVLFSNQKWDEAILSYQAALKVKSSESYPQEQIDIAQARLGDLAQLETNYKSAITEGDKFFREKNFQEAILSYERALALKSEENYPTVQIDKATIELEALTAADAAYMSALRQADSLYDQSLWGQAIFAYEEASKLRPKEAYPQEQIVKAKNSITEREQLEKDYQAAIAEGSRFINARNWSGAIEAFEKAVALKPEETYPQEQLARAKTELRALEDTENLYNSTIVEADQYFSEELFDRAKSSYQAALELKQGEKYPNDKIKEIDKILADKEAAYSNKIAEADKLFQSEKWAEAKETYRAALQMKPEEIYPQSQITLADEQIRSEQERLAVQQELEQNYQSVIAQADQAFNIAQWHEAIALYQDALTIKAGESYPQQQIDLANKELETLAANRFQFGEYLKQADELYQLEQWEEAKSTYALAAALFPDEKYPSQRISAIADILANIARIEAEYKSVVASADAALFVNNYDEAKRLYEEALGLKSEEVYPKQKLKEIENLMDAEKAAENARLYREYVAEANALIKEKDLAGAIEKLNAALEYRPNDDFATKRIAELQKILDDTAFALSEYNRLIVEADDLFAQEKYRDAINSYRLAMRHRPDELYPRKKVAEAERNLEYTPARRKQLAQENMQRGQDAFNSRSYEAAMRGFGMAYYWYPEEGNAPKAQMNAVLAAIESGAETQETLEMPLSLAANRRGIIEMDFKPGDLKGTTYALLKVSGNYDGNVNLFLRWGRFNNEHNATVLTIINELDDVYYCAEIKGASSGLTWISIMPENVDLVIEEVKLVSK
ncbi:MAG: hypothetical protein LBH92_05540 [Bacteroidales bacterium]|jgi:tetratricopeptide (TPR) repeat protein|nr:hypothetical protein [Bacteroidales bacterium]